MNTTKNYIIKSSPQTPETSNQHPASSIQYPASSSRPFIIPIFLPHAGCPHQCVFCNQVSITGEKRKALTADCLSAQIHQYLKYVRGQRSVVQIAFFGGNFLGLKNQQIKLLLEQATEFVKRGRVDSIRFSTRPDTIDNQRMDIIQDYPVSTIELGVQSMDDQVLALSKRGHTSLDTVQAVSILKQSNYEIGLQIMVGLPGDDEEKMMNTGKMVVGLKPDFVRIYPTVVVEGSPLAEWYRNGKYKPLSTKDAISQVMDLYLCFQRNWIKTIRMGLQASEDFEAGQTILAGPYHPAFGHLVHSAIFLDKARATLKSHPPLNEHVAIKVHPRSISKMRGLNNSNIKKLQKQFHLKSIKTVPDSSLSEEHLIVK